MIIKKSGGRWQLSLLASAVISAFFLNTAYAWQQEYIVDTQPGHSTERYTWDSDHQPDYNDILSQRIQSSQRALGLDIIFYDDLVYASDDLAIPHIDMENRYFVLKPLSELAPNFRHPITHKTVTQMLSELPVDLTEGNEA